MSAAAAFNPTATLSTTAPISHLHHTAHPLPLREHAFTLHCQGLRSPAIAEALGVSQRTIRSWIAAALQEIKDDQQFSRREQLALAVERQRALTVAAWQQFEAESTVRAALLDAARAALTHPDLALTTSTDGPAQPHAPSTSTSTSTAAPDLPAAAARPAPLHLHLPATTPAPRYLSLILQANKEIARLLGLYTLARLEILRPDSPPDQTNPLLADDASDASLDSPAQTATAPVSSVASPHLASPLSPQGEGLGARAPSPAKTATASLAPAERMPPLSSQGKEPGVRTVGQRARSPRPWMM